MRVKIERLESSDHGTFGRILFNDNVLFSGELPDRNNQRNISCIPTGIYQVDWTYSPTFKRFMYLVRDVPERSGIRIHSANLMGDKSCNMRSQLYGCIALGEKLGHIDGQKAVMLSRPAVAKLETGMKRKSFELEIKNAGLSW